MKKAILLLAAVCALSACDKTYTVKEFQADKELRLKYLEKCQNGELNGEDQNCHNADMAATLG